MKHNELQYKFTSTFVYAKWKIISGDLFGTKYYTKPLWVTILGVLLVISML